MPQRERVDVFGGLVAGKKDQGRKKFGSIKLRPVERIESFQILTNVPIRKVDLTSSQANDVKDLLVAI